MGLHIEARPDDIAPTILLPGDPRRARAIAGGSLDDAVCFNEVRGMLGYTGTYAGRPVSVMGTGMGVPSISIYVHELIHEYGVRRLLRVGTCGALQPELGTGDVILAMAASTDSHINRLRFGGRDFAPTASFPLLLAAYRTANDRDMRVQVGGVLTSDSFYADDPEGWKRWAAYGVLAVEMETAALYTLAAGAGVEALSILTVSDLLPTGEHATAEQRERGFTTMAELALTVATC